jgi:c-di-GMP-binding flagellar brake protein YcgR
LAGALLQAQKIQPKPGEAARDALRVPRAVQVDLAMTAGRQKMLTRELGRGGFTAVVAYGPAPNERFEGTIRVPGQPDPVEIAVQVVSSRRAAGTCFVTFNFTRIDEAQRERLGHAVFDTALENLQV